MKTSIEIINLAIAEAETLKGLITPEQSALLNSDRLTQYGDNCIYAQLFGGNYSLPQALETKATAATKDIDVEWAVVDLDGPMMPIGTIQEKPQDAPTSRAWTSPIEYLLIIDQELIVNSFIPYLKGETSELVVDSYWDEPAQDQLPW